ncbi:MAG: CorA family divalent cation transporter [Candidatus Methanoperedens sp.]|nr:CorA family divalent cation transporter [Candidatus Methanoperedens sp.]
MNEEKPVPAPEEKKEQIAVILPKSDVNRAFCVALPVSGGKPLKLTGDNPHDFLQFLKESSVAWLNFPVKDIKKDAEIIAMSLGFSSTLVPTLFSSYLSAYEDRDTEMGLMLPAVAVKKFDVLISPILILIRKDLILTIHEENVNRLIRLSRYADAFMRKIKPTLINEDKLTIILTRIIDENINRNFDHLREIEAQGDELSKILTDTSTPRGLIGPEIYNMKHALISYMDTLWATLDVVNSLRHGDAELISDSPKLLARLGILSDDVNRHIALSEHMSDVLASGLEVLQSIYNNQLQILNNRLQLVITWLTILGTAVLVPNTLATVFSNPAFEMGPQDKVWYSIMLVVATIFSTWIAYWWIKKKGLLPFKVD